jgi:hypothetical protein
MSRQCTQIKANGERCQSRAIEGSERCFFHADPGKLLTATSLGGKQGKRTVLQESSLSLRSVENVKLLLETTINEVRTGQLDRAIGNTVGYLAGILIKALELSDSEHKLDRVTEILTHE